MDGHFCQGKNSQAFTTKALIFSVRAPATEAEFRPFEYLLVQQRSKMSTSIIIFPAQLLLYVAFDYVLDLAVEL
jgi:hypothetical protein